MQRLDRLQSILIRLQSRRVITARELADIYGVSIRSIYRDLRTLEEAGVPIGAEAGVGYFLPDNYHLPPVMFSPDEASALLIGGKLTQRLTDEPMGQAYDSALAKIKAILHQTAKENLEIIENQIEVFPNMGPAPISVSLTEIQRALSDSHVLTITYQKPDGPVPEQRAAEPLGLCYYGGNWHLIAWCRSRKAYRDFRADRIKKVITTNETFHRDSHPSLRDYFAKNLREANLHGITLVVNSIWINNIREMKYAYGFAGQEQHGDTTLMHFLNSDLRGFARWILNAGPHARILKPEALKAELGQLIDELRTTHGF